MSDIFSRELGSNQQNTENLGSYRQHMENLGSDQNHLASQLILPNSTVETVALNGETVNFGGQQCPVGKINVDGEDINVMVIKAHPGGLIVPSPDLEPNIKIVIPYYTMVPFGSCHICGAKNPQNQCNSRYTEEMSPLILYCNDENCKKSAEVSMQRYYMGIDTLSYKNDSKTPQINFKVKRTSGKIEDDWKIHCLRYHKSNECPTSHGKFAFCMSNSTVQKAILLENFAKLNPEVDIMSIKPDRIEYVLKPLIEMAEKAFQSIKENGTQEPQFYT